MKSTLYNLKDISEITGKTESKILEAVVYLGIVRVVKFTRKMEERFFFTEDHLKLIKYYLNDYHSKQPIKVPTNIITAVPDEENHEIKMAESKTSPLTWYIFRSSGEEVEITVKLSNETFSTHYLTMNECSYVREFCPQIPFIDYKIQKKIYH